MWMTEAEICKNYRNSARPQSQIDVLAELNGESARNIVKVLLKNNIDIKNKNAIKNAKLTDDDILEIEDHREKMRLASEEYIKNLRKMKKHNNMRIDIA